MQNWVRFNCKYFESAFRYCIFVGILLISSYQCMHTLDVTYSIYIPNTQVVPYINPNSSESQVIMPSAGLHDLLRSLQVSGNLCMLSNSVTLSWSSIGIHMQEIGIPGPLLSRALLHNHFHRLFAESLLLSTSNVFRIISQF